MINFILAATLACPSIKMENKTSFPWNDFDYKNLKKAEKRCGELYKTSLCVKRFIKWGEKDYSVVCGKKS